ncbi:hypothetical protein BHM03_00030284 [Ensete ventricosum]|nr:hypothetical protein BHM03_00030284 [Ensete ventricosum]
MNATGSMGIAVTVRPCCRLLAAQLFPECPCHQRRAAAAAFFFPRCPHDRLRASKCPRAPSLSLAPQRRSAASWVRAALAPARDEAAVSDARRLSTAAGPVPGGDRAFERIFVQGLAAVEPLVIERVAEQERMLVVEEKRKVEEVEEEQRAEMAKAREVSESEKEAWRLLKNAVVDYCGSPVGTVAATDPAVEALNYDQVFIRDFVPSALAFLLKGETEIVRNFLLYTLQLQVKRIKIPVSFPLLFFEEMLDPDFGESAIGRVAPVDSGEPFTSACIKMGRPELARKAIAIAENRLLDDKWPEYYDTPTGRFIGKQSRLYQTWTIAGFLASKLLLENPEMASILTFEEDLELLEGCACSLIKSPRTQCSRHAAKSHVLH